MKKRPEIYDDLFKAYAQKEITATQIAKEYGVNRSSFLQCYKRELERKSENLNELEALQFNDLKAYAQEVALKALEKISTMLDNTITAQEYCELMKAFKNICEAIGLAHMNTIAIQNNINCESLESENQKKNFEIKVNFLNRAELEF